MNEQEIRWEPYPLPISCDIFNPEAIGWHNLFKPMPIRLMSREEFKKLYSDEDCTVFIDREGL